MLFENRIRVSRTNLVLLDTSKSVSAVLSLNYTVVDDWNILLALPDSFSLDTYFVRWKYRAFFAVYCI